MHAFTLLPPRPYVPPHPEPQSATALGCHLLGCHLRHALLGRKGKALMALSVKTSKYRLSQRHTHTTSTRHKHNTPRHRARQQPLTGAPRQHLKRIASEPARLLRTDGLSSGLRSGSGSVVGAVMFTLLSHSATRKFPTHHVGAIIYGAGKVCVLTNLHDFERVASCALRV